MPDELAQASEVFITGTAAEVTPVGEIDDHRYTPGDVTHTLMEDYEKVVGKQPQSAASARLSGGRTNKNMVPPYIRPPGSARAYPSSSLVMKR